MGSLADKKHEHLQARARRAHQGIGPTPPETQKQREARQARNQRKQERKAIAAQIASSNKMPSAPLPRERRQFRRAARIVRRYGVTI
jgi:hypothetical protein